MTVRTFRGSRSLYHPLGRSTLCPWVLESPWNAESGLQPFSPTRQWKIYQGDGEGTLQGMEIPCKLQESCGEDLWRHVDGPHPGAGTGPERSLGKASYWIQTSIKRLLRWRRKAYYSMRGFMPEDGGWHGVGACQWTERVTNTKRDLQKLIGKDGVWWVGSAEASRRPCSKVPCMAGHYFWGSPFPPAPAEQWCCIQTSIQSRRWLGCTIWRSCWIKCSRQGSTSCERRVLHCVQVLGFLLALFM